MSLESRSEDGVLELTARVVRASFPRGTLAMRIREVLGALFTDEDFVAALPDRGRPAISPGALALVSVLQYAEGLSDRQAADQVRARMDWKFLLALELDDPGFDFTVLGDFRSRLIMHGLEERVLEAMLARLSEAGLLRAGGRQRTDSTHGLAAVRTLNRMGFVGETLRAALEALAAAAPHWLAPLISSAWVERYGNKVDNYRFPKGENVRREWAEQVGWDGFALLDAIDGPAAVAWLREVPAVRILRRAWAEQYHRDGEGVHWREGKDLPPARDRLSSPYDTDAHYGIKRGTGWCGYKVHLSETCEPDAPHLITNVETTNATVNDTEVTATIHQRLAERGLRPREHVVDAGYVTAAHILAAREDHGIDLVGPVGADTHHNGRDAQAPDLTQAALTLHHQLGRPAGHLPPGSLQRQLVPAAQGQRDPARPGALRARRLRSMPAETEVHQSIQQQMGPQPDPAAPRAATDPRRTTCRAANRPVEGPLRRASRGGGHHLPGRPRSHLRRTPYQGQHKTHLANVLSATALNLTRIDAWLNNTPLGTTRVSHLARLTLAA